MVDVNGNTSFAFSTVFSGKKDLTPYSIKINHRMIRGMGDTTQQKIKDIIRINNLGTFLERESDKMAEKIKGVSSQQIKKFQIEAKKEFKNFKKTIEKPSNVIETAIAQIFSLFDIEQKEIEKGKLSGKKKLFQDKSNEIQIIYKSNNDVDEINKLSEVHKSKRYGFEVDWKIHNLTGGKWDQRIQKAQEIFISTSLKYLIPGVGGLIGSLVNKKLKKLKDKDLVDETNSQFNDIFYELIKGNLAIEYLSYRGERKIKSPSIKS